MLFDDGSRPTRIAGYEVHEELGRGATSVVYRVTREGRSFALKLSRVAANAGDEGAKLRIRREASALGRLQHPALVAVVETGTHAGRPFVVMERVEGETLAQRLARGPLPRETLVGIGDQLASALDAAHVLGVVHRDVKPANVILARDGRPRLVDFGLATHHAAVGGRRGVVGTVLYAAPEQLGVIDHPIDGRADLYGLGCTLFHAATGQVPFPGDEADDVIRQHTESRAPAAASLRPQLGRALSAVIQKLLARDPAERYASGAGVVADLARLDEIEAALERDEEVELGASDPVLPVQERIALVGRGEQLEALHTAWESACRGEGGVVLLRGEHGAGKTRLLDEITATAARSEAAALVARADGEERAPFASLRAAIDSHLAEAASCARAGAGARLTRARDAAADVAPMLAPVSRALHRLAGSPQPPPELDAARVGDAAAAYLVELATAHGGLLLAIDDAEGVDAGTAQVLVELASRAPSAPLLVLLCLPAASSDEAAQTRWLDGLGPGAQTIELGPLAAGDVRALARAQLGPVEVDERWLERLAAVSHGNPYAVGEFLRAAVEAGLLVPQRGRWRVDEEGFDGLRLPRNVLQLIERRVASVDDDIAAGLLIGATLGREFELSTFVAVLGDTAEAARIVSAAATEQLVERTPRGTIAFLHEHTRRRLLERADVRARRAAHQAVARALDGGVAGEDRSEAVFAVARHYEAGLPEELPRRTYETNLRAGRLALEGAAHADAYDYLTTAARVAELLPADADADPAGLAEALGRAAQGVGRNDEAIEHFRAALPHAATPLRRAEIHGWIARVHVDEVRLDEAWQECTRALAAIGRPYPRARLVQVVLALAAWAWASLQRRVGYRAGAARGEERTRRKLLCRLYRLAGETRYYDFQPLPMLLLTLRQLPHAHRLGPCRETVETMSWFGAVLGNLKKRKLARAYGRLAIEQAEQLEDRAAAVTARMWWNFATHFLGDVREAAEQWRASMPDIARWLHPREFNKSVSDCCINLMMRGHARDALDVAVAGLGNADRARLSTSSMLSQAYCAASLSMLGRKAEARQHGAEALAISDVLPEAERWGRANMLTYVLLAELEQEDGGPGLDALIERFERLAIPAHAVPAHPRPFYVLRAYARLRQYERADSAGEPAARQRLEHALAELKAVRKLSYNDCHHAVIQAAVDRHDGELERALERIEQAEWLAQDADSAWGMFEMLLERARLSRDQGDEREAQRDAQEAYELAVRHGWAPRAARVQASFQTRTAAVGGLQGAVRDVSRTGTTVSVLGHETPVSVSLHQQHKALYRVCAAASRSIDAREQAIAALDALIDQSGAERGFLFLYDEAHAEPRLLAGRDLHGGDVADVREVRGSVMRQLRADGEPVLLTGGEADEPRPGGTSSHTLRSVVAAPMRRWQQDVGAIYLDSALSNGLFGRRDATLLAAVADHLALALGIATAARDEVERAQRRRDEVLGDAVDRLVLPVGTALETPRLAMAACRRAPRFDGSWWWADAGPGDRLLAALGWIPGADEHVALMAAGIAASCRQHRGGTDGLLPSLDGLVRGHVNTRQGAPTAAVELVWDGTPTLRWWNAGGPPVLVRHADGAVETLSCPGRPIGGVALDVGAREQALQPGDRVLMFTDAGGGPGAGSIAGITRQLQRCGDTSPRRALSAIADASGDGDGSRTWLLFDVDSGCEQTA